MGEGKEESQGGRPRRGEDGSTAVEFLEQSEESESESEEAGEGKARKSLSSSFVVSSFAEKSAMAEGAKVEAVGR